MRTASVSDGAPAPPAPRTYGLPLSERPALPDADAEGISEELIRVVVAEFYRRARRDGRLGPVFEAHVHEWEVHLARMNEFWSAALLRTGRYSGRPVGAHRAIVGIAAGHFDRWVELFEDTVRDLCPPRQADAFRVRARRMRDGMIMVLGLRDGSSVIPMNRGGDGQGP